MISQTVKKCSVCQRGYPLSAAFCPFDGTSLVETFTSDGGPAATPVDEPIATPSSDPLVGRTVERYRIVKEIGHGGMGSVYRAVHTELNRTVAIKVMHKDLGADSVAVRRFRREALALGALVHPNAVNVTDFGMIDGDVPFLVMEYLEGVDLRHVIAREAPLPLTRAASILSQICAAVSAAHRVGIVHRDLKPENIMLVEGEDGEVAKVLDFGIARLASSEGSTGRLTGRDVVLGTPNYMSPEGCRGFEQTGASDVYSLGVILFELITGRFVFESADRLSPPELGLRHVKEPPPAPSSRNPDLSPEIDAVVLRALAKKPELRQPSAVELAREFEAAVAELGALSSAPIATNRETGIAPASETIPDLTPQDTKALDAPPAVTTSMRRYDRALVGIAIALILVILAAAFALLGVWLGWFGHAAPS